MTELPVANDGASFQAVVDSGKFQGTIAATTPSGRRCTNARLFAGVGGISSYTLSIASPLQRIVRTADGTSTPVVSAMGLPTSRHSSSAISSAWSSMSSAQRTSTILRSAGAMSAQTPLSNADRAIPTAWSASSMPQLATSAELLPIARTDRRPGLAGQRILVASVDECAAFEFKFCRE